MEFLQVHLQQHKNPDVSNTTNHGDDSIASPINGSQLGILLANDLTLLLLGYNPTHSLPVLLSLSPHLYPIRYPAIVKLEDLHEQIENTFSHHCIHLALFPVPKNQPLIIESNCQHPT